MSATALVTLVAMVVSAEGHFIRVDKGLIDGLREGDRGVVYYTLTVASAEKAIEVGSGRVTAIDDFSATVSVLPEATVRPGYLVRFEIEAERTSPAGLFALARAAHDAGRLDAARRYLGEIRVAPDDPYLPKILAELEKLRASAGMVWIPGGSYEVGVDLPEAKFYNQHPRFELPLRSLWIDRRSVTREEFREFRPDFSFPPDGPEEFATAVAFAEAESYCRWRGKRLPNELEWEVAAGAALIATAASLHEWTASWYKPYPGNHLPEKEYGGHYRVLRAVAAEDDFDCRRRRFLAPELRQSNVGFRCARDAADDASGDDASRALR
ncbi:MAG: SUMF1/EgtB/PvdO family nonheme iron enzyme [bacterium]|nr:SUMF1/EgtB/PvdO family nonheme iron enzyme [bacterium]